jgi:hypothetical protein
MIEPSVLLPILIGSFFFSFLFNGTSTPNEKFDKTLHNMEQGTCPECGCKHPEAAKQDPYGFWTNFACPECGHHVKAHVHPVKIHN